MTGKEMGYMAGGGAVGYLVDKALVSRVSFLASYPEIADIGLAVLGWFLAKKMSKAKDVGHGLIAVGIGLFILDVASRIPSVTA